MLVHFGSPEGTMYQQPEKPKPVLHFGSPANEQKS